MVTTLPTSAQWQTRQMKVRQGESPKYNQQLSNNLQTKMALFEKWIAPLNLITDWITFGDNCCKVFAITGNDNFTWQELWFKGGFSSRS